MELVVTENITLDGVIDATEGWFDPAGTTRSTPRTSSRRCNGRWRDRTRYCSVG
jgi:hypothetical protein